MPENSTRDERAAQIAPSGNGVDLLARFAFVDSDDSVDVAHAHGDTCSCQLRGR